ncbi:MAG: hypothetical protein COB85_01910 [Bacteroidetes bacterium]|nr:MAG: hypothetical protein COB85_01910 [Bacteroidota bacterium]
MKGKLRYILILLLVTAGLTTLIGVGESFANGHTVVLTGYNTSCKDSCDGSIKATMSGGCGPFVYDWLSGPWAGEPGDSIFDLCIGTYTVIVEDLGCGGFTSASISITEPAAIGIIISPPSPTTNCFGVCDGSATALPIGGNGGYTYLWTGGETTSTAVALCAGSNTILITDSKGCTGDTTITVGQPPPLLANVTGVDPDCNVGCNGTAESVPSGGTSPYTHLWNTGSTGTALSGLCAGTYSDTVTDANGCINVGTVILIDPPALILSMSKTDETCGGDCDGTVSADVTGGTTPYTYNWDTTPVQTDSVAAGLCAGTYCVTVTDANGCQATGCLDVFAPPILTTGADSTDVLCNGDSTGTAIATPVGGTGAYTFQWDGLGSQTTNPAIGLPSGPYCVTVTDANGCPAFDCTVVNEPSALTLDLDSIEPSCNGDSDGSAIAIVTGGTGLYTYLWNDGGTQTNATATGLSAGTYCVTVTDAVGCQILGCVDVTQPLALTNSMFQIDESCFGTCNAQAWTVPVGGTGAYTYIWDEPSPVSTTDTAFNLCVGAANVTVTDASGCTTTGGVTITTIPVMVLNMDSVTLACGGICTGEAIVNVASGGTSPFTYVWDDPDTQTNATATGLCAGAYCVTVTDANGCTETGCLTIGEPPPLVLTVDSTNVSCTGADDATATANVSGGTLAYTYLWSTGSGGTSIGPVPASPPSYCVTVTDGAGCTISDCVNPDEPIALALFTGSSDVQCNGACDGTGTAFASGGTFPYTYIWDDPLGQTTFLATGLCPGTWNVTVTDARGCFLVDFVVISEPSPVVANESTTDATCGVCDGQVCVAPTGGTSPYTINWFTIPSPLNCVSGLCAGSYPVEITDAAGCIDTVVVNLGNTPVMTLAMDSTDVSCFGDCDGTATVLVVSGGTAPYTYLWDDLATQTNATATGLCIGLYVVEVTDAGGCIQFDSIRVGGPIELLANLTVTDVLCAGDANGSICSSPSGGVGLYTFLWGDATTGSCRAALGPGTYFVTVTDASGCDTIVSGTVLDQTILTLATDSVDVLCNGDGTGMTIVIPSGGVPPYTYAWDDLGTQSTDTAFGLTAGTYCVTVTDANACINNLCITIDEPALIVLDSSQTNVSCFGGNDGTATAIVAGGIPGYIFAWNTVPSQTNATATGLTIGTYCVTVTDVNLCQDSSCVTITEPPLLTAPIVGFNLSCNGVCTGTGIVTPSGGTPPYVYIWDDPGAQTDSVATGLCAGTWNVTVTDANLCTATASILITEPPLLVLDSAKVDILCNGDATGQAIAIIAGGSPPYVIIWDDPGSQTTDTAFNLTAGTYCVTITDANFCMDSSCVTLTEPPPIDPGFNTDSATCGVCDGVARSVPTGGISSYTFDWLDTIPPQNSADTLDSLCAGVYQLEITDANGCIDTFSVGISNIGAPIIDSVDTVNVSCFGACDGSATVYVSGGTPPYTYLWNDPLTQTDSVATGLCAGTFICQITDGAGCILTVTVIITEPTQIISNMVITSIDCFGACNGAVSVSPTGGVPPYTYLWDDIGASTDSSLTGLCPDTLHVTITDFTGCSIIDSVIITEPAGALTVTIPDSTNISCFGLCDGDATVRATGGTPGYTYVWSGFPFQSDTVVTGLCAGLTKVVVTDANGCQDSVEVNIFEPSDLTSSITSDTNISCFGLCDGIAIVTPVGGTPGYTYNWFSAGSSTDSTVSVLCANTSDSVEVTDANGCQDTTVVSLTEPPLLTILITDSTSVSCNVACDGSVTGTPSGGTPPYTYSWNTSPVQTDSVAINICGGVADTVTVTDANGCTAIAIVTLAEPALLTASITDSTNINCNGLCDGTATVTPVGGTINYTYNWVSAGAQTDSVATGLCPGTIDTVVVTDSRGCFDTAFVSLTEPGSLTASIDSVNNISCFGLCNGVIYASASGGTTPYTYLWSNGDTVDSAVALCAGIAYFVTITDTNGCQDSIIGGTILTQPSEIVAIITDSTDVTCNSANGPCDGTATVSVSGGFPPYTYLWSTTNLQTDTMATGLCAGLIDTVWVTDSIGCTDTTALTLSEPPPIIITFTDSAYPSCNAVCDGMATINVVGGTPAYTYLWNDPSGQTDTIATGLCDGFATVLVTDSLGCFESDSIELIEPTPIVMSIVSQTSASCDSICDAMAVVSATGGTSPYTFTWSTGTVNDTATGLCASTYSITVTDGNGCTTVDTVVITGPAGLTSSITTITMISCFGLCDGSAMVTASGGVPPYTYAWQDTSIGAIGGNFDTIMNLCADSDYVAIIRDANNCLTMVPFIITEPAPLSVNICDTLNVACNLSCDGSATVCPSGGTPAFTYIWTDTLGQIVSTDSIADSLCAGIYRIDITDGNGCIAVDSLVVITQPDLLSCSFYDTVMTGCGADSAVGKVWVTGLGGTAPYSYAWNTTVLPPDTLDSAINLLAGNYNVTVTDINGCQSVCGVSITDTSDMAASITDSTMVSCFGLCDGEAIVTPTGSTSPYTYNWVDVTGTPILDFDSTANNLCTGLYRAIVESNAGCLRSIPIFITEPALLEATIIDSTGAMCNNDSNGTATVGVTGGSAPYTYAWTDTLGATIGTDSLLDSVIAGIYCVLVTDSNGCQDSICVTITQPNVLTVTDSITPATCSNTCDGIAVVTPAGGTAPFTYSWAQDSTNTSSTDTLCVDTFYVTVTDTNGCSIVDTVIITPSIVSVANAGPDTTICQGDTLTLSAGPAGTYDWYQDTIGTSLGSTQTISFIPSDSGFISYILVVGDSICSDTDTVVVYVIPVNVDAGPDVQIAKGQCVDLNGTVLNGTVFNWTPIATLNDPNIEDPEACPDETTTYYLTATNDSECPGTDSVTITVIPEIPDGITPNADGYNDVWELFILTNYPNCEVQVYNRWGELIFESPEGDMYVTKFDGTYNGKPLPVGTYYYVIKFNEDTDGILKETLTGPITIMR